MNSLHKNLLAAAAVVALGVIGLVMDSRPALAQGSPGEPAMAGWSPLENKSTVRVLFGVDTTESGIFPSDAFTVPDDVQKTGLRVNLPLPDCSVRVSDCRDLALINVLDGFNLQPRVTIPFDGDIDPTTVNSSNTFFVELGDADVDALPPGNEDGGPRVIGVNQLVWDPATRVLAAESDEQLRQHTKYAFVVTAGVLDVSGAPVTAAEDLERFRHDLNFGQTHDPVLDSYRKNMLDALAALRKLGISQEQVAGLSVFTTQSATAVMEHIRDQIKASHPEPMNFQLGPGGSRTVFTLSSVQAIDWQQQVRVNPPGFQSFKPQYPGETQPLLLLDQYSPGAVGRIAFGAFPSPRYIGDDPIMPTVGTRAGVPPVQQVETLHVNLFIPAGPQPPAGWPVVIFGVGGGDSKDELPYFYAAAFATRGVATACMNVVGQGFGPLSFLKVTLKDGSTVQFPAPGRGKDLNGDGIIGATEGVAVANPDDRTVGARDSLRQDAIDLMQLVRVIEAGVDVDGDGVADLDPTQISFFGVSFGGGYGQVFLGVEPNASAGVLTSPAAQNSRPDVRRLVPPLRSGVGTTLASRIPSLLNSPGLTSFAGFPVSAPFFNENIPLRNQPIVTEHVDGAMEIQEYFDRVAWITTSGDAAAYAPNIRREPLPGNSPKALLINFGKGDAQVATPRTTQLIRAGGNADVTTYYRNDLAHAEDNTVFKNSHVYVQWWVLPGPAGAIGRGGLDQVLTFIASRGQVILHPEPARFFETPISLPLPEDFTYIP
jgi:hypothetical protein